MQGWQISQRLLTVQKGEWKILAVESKKDSKIVVDMTSYVKLRVSRKRERSR